MHHRHRSSSRPVGPSAFTLAELLVAIAIVAVLAALGATVCSAVSRRARTMREVAAGRTLITAYLAHAADHAGQFLPGMDYSVNRVTKPDGTTLAAGHVAQRYPYRLAPYFGYRIDGVVLVNGNRDQIKATDSYTISAFPAFGINYTFVGGLKTANGTIVWNDECLTRQAMAEVSPLVFATAGSRDAAGNGYDGYNMITAPHSSVENWTREPWCEDALPNSYGFIDARHNGKAVCVFLDGSVRMLAVEELRDMRKWSRLAALADDPEYFIPR